MLGLGVVLICYFYSYFISLIIIEVAFTYNGCRPLDSSLPMVLGKGIGLPIGGLGRFHHSLRK